MEKIELRAKGRTKDKPKVEANNLHGKGKGKTTLKQKAFVKELVKTKNGTQAIINAGYNVKSRQIASNMAVENLKKTNIQNALLVELEKVGLTDSRIAELLEEAIVSGVGRDSRNSDALRGLDMLNKMKGTYAPKKIDKREISFSLQGKEDTELTELMQEQLKLLKALTGED